MVGSLFSFVFGILLTLCLLNYYFQLYRVNKKEYRGRGVSKRTQCMCLMYVWGVEKRWELDTPPFQPLID